MRLKSRSRISASGLDQQRLGQARHARDEAVPAGEERYEDLLHHFVLTDDHLAELGQDLFAPFGDALGAHSDFFVGIHLSRLWDL